mmetsp:Transcript_99496/g.319274  ORF Transcript_99496/g.319274 Transcript_99496/m.319274 type:complete len:293 (+) Transcript_99496:102-980(+)
MAAPLVEVSVEERRAALETSNQELLAKLCSRGDFLSAASRTSIVREALAATAACPACISLHGEGKSAGGQDLFRRIDCLKHQFAEPAACGGLGPVVHAVANQQHILDEEWYAAAADRVYDALLPTGEEPKQDGRDERNARLAEVIEVTALAVGLRAYYRAIGNHVLPVPPALPQKGSDGEARFAKVADLSTSGYVYASNAWGPTLKSKTLKAGVLDQQDVAFLSMFDMSQHPGSKWSPSPSCTLAFFQWGATTYVPEDRFVKFFTMSPGCVLDRGSMEVVAAKLTGMLQCSF